MPKTTALGHSCSPLLAMTKTRETVHIPRSPTDPLTPYNLSRFRPHTPLQSPKATSEAPKEFPLVPGCLDAWSCGEAASFVTSQKAIL